MKWCAKCKFEYEDYVDRCSDCGELLVTDEAYSQLKENKNSAYYPDSIKLAVVYESTLESDVLHVTELLKDNGIYSEIKNEGIGSYLQIYGGVNYLGTSICVKEEDAETARALIENLWGMVNSEAQQEVGASMAHDEEDLGMEEYRQSYNKSLNLKKNMLKLFILLIFGSGLVIQLLSILN